MVEINIAEAKSSFSELVSRTAAGERFVIRRRGKALAALVNPSVLERLERNAGMAYRLALALGQDAALLSAVEKNEVHPAMSAFGLWKNEELEDLANEIYAERAGMTDRPVVDYENS
ncbi:MAG: type II toxin-antitoxin system Phd/YefM family antitoxin [Anaerolineales bacterium]|nr:type II toxin-antitoxin system Phd/YefM family antitoxin [Anaerolineales bacterium]